MRGLGARTVAPVNGASAHDVVMDGGWGDVWLWWLEHGLDGIAGAVLAVGGVAATLWWDRKKRLEEQVHQDQAEIERVVQRILEKALDAEVAGWKADSLSALEREIKLAEATLHRIPELGRSITMLGALVGLTVRRNDVNASRVAHSIARRCTTWLRDPATYSASVHDRAEVRAYGSTVINEILGTPENDAEHDPPSS